MCNRYRELCLVGALGAAALCLMLMGGTDPGYAEDRTPADEGLPADLARVPQNALMLASVNVGQLWDHEAIQKIRKDMPREVALVNGVAEQSLGVSLADIERLTIVGTVAQTRDPFVFFVHTRKPYDPKKVRGTLGGSQREAKVGEETYLVGERNRALLILDGRTFVVGDESEVRWLLETPEARKPGPLAGAVRAAGKHAGVAAVNATAFPAEVKANAPAEAAPFLPLFDAEAGLVTVDLADRLTASLRITFDGEKEAREGLKPLQALVGLMGVGLGEAVKLLETGPEETKSLIAVIQQAQAALNEVKVRHTGPTLEVQTSVKVDLAPLAPALAAAAQQMRLAAARMSSSNNLKQMGLAMHNYHEVHGRFPPPAVYDRDGKPTLSWRVLLLPYLERDDLYKQFKLNEPWDSPHNKKLLDKMPATFAAPTEKKAEPYTTFYQAVVGKGSVWDSKRGARIPDVTDGLSNTILIVEASKAVPWTKPEDVPFDPEKELPKLGGLYPGGFHALLGDGAVKFLSAKMSERTLRHAILRNDGMPLGSDF